MNGNQQSTINHMMTRFKNERNLDAAYDVRMLGSYAYVQFHVSTPNPFPELRVGAQGGWWSDAQCRGGEIRTFPNPAMDSLLYADERLAKQNRGSRGSVRPGVFNVDSPPVTRYSSTSDGVVVPPSGITPTGRVNPYNFVLQFPPTRIDELVRRRLGNVAEENAMAAGRAIARGEYTLGNLKTIVCWKSERRAGLLDDNTSASIADALRVASDARTAEASAVAALVRLDGVGVPVASAILTTINPEKYTIIDFRALISLGSNKKPPYSIDFYLAYLARCRELAHELNISLRTLDHALWQWYDDPQRVNSDSCRTVRAV